MRARVQNRRGPFATWLVAVATLAVLGLAGAQALHEHAHVEDGFASDCTICAAVRSGTSATAGPGLDLGVPGDRAHPVVAATVPRIPGRAIASTGSRGPPLLPSAS